jgi:hypothetical protein
VLVVEHAHEFDGEIADVTHSGVDVRAGDRPGRRGFQVAEVRLFARSGMGVRDVQA